MYSMTAKVTLCSHFEVSKARYSIERESTEIILENKNIFEFYALIFISVFLKI